MQKKKALISQGLDLVRGGGDGRDRTADLLIANQSLSQLSYAPKYRSILYHSIQRIKAQQLLAGTGNGAPQTIGHRFPGGALGKCFDGDQADIGMIQIT